MTTAFKPANPYIGPRAFRAGERLYGRDRETGELLDLLIAERIVLLYSPSGAGKSSLVQAGLLPRLREENFSVLPVMRVNAEPPPGIEGLNRYALSAMLALDEEQPPAQRATPATLAGQTLATYLKALLGPDSTANTVLIFDQFEEILTSDPTNIAAKNAFFSQLGQALRDRRLWALFALREDYLAGLDPYLRFVPTRFATHYRLDLLDVAGACEAMQLPAKDAGVNFTLAAAQQLADNLRRVKVQRTDGSFEERLGPYVEPVQLQVVCRRLWEQLPSGDNEITPDDLREVGAVDEALRDYYAAEVQEVVTATAVSERAVRDWFDTQLITQQGVRGQVVQGAESSGGLKNDAVRRLVDSHLVRSEKRLGATWYELAHDRLIGPVQQNNAAWREDNLSTLQRQGAIWHASGRSPGLLLRGEALLEAERWAVANPELLTQVEQDFLAACQESRRQQQRVRNLSIGAAILAVVATIAFFTALAFYNRSEAARIEALSRQLAAESAEAARRDPEQALLLAVEGVRQRPDDPLPAASSALYSALAQSGGTPISAGTAELYAVAFSPDGGWLAAAGADGLLRLWNMADLNAPPRKLSGHKGAILRLAFSPDGRLLASGDDSFSLRIWSLDNLAADPVVLDDFEGPISALAFSPDGRFFAASGDQNLRLWQVPNFGVEARILSGHQEAISALAFSPDGQTIASASLDQTARLWRVADGAELRVLRGHTAALETLAFSPDGTYLATGGQDSRVLLWDLGRPNAQPVTLAGHQSFVKQLVFSPDSQVLASAGDESNARLWSVADGVELTVLRGHELFLTGLAFSPDGRYLVTGGEDATMRIWNPAAPGLLPLILRGQAAPVRAAAISPDSGMVAAAADDGSLRLWRLAAGNAIVALRDDRDAIAVLERRGDNSLLASGSFDGQIRLRDLSHPEQVQALDAGGQPLVALASSSTARHLAAAANDGTTRIWDLQAPDTPPTILPARADPAATADADGRPWAVSLAFAAGEQALTAAFSDGAVVRWQLAALGTPALLVQPLDGAQATAVSLDGHYAARATDGGQIELWTLDTAAAPQQLPNVSTDIAVLAFSADGQRLAAGGFDGLVQWWNLRRNTEQPAQLVGHLDRISALAFSADGTLLLSGSVDQTARLWRLGQAADPLVLRGSAAAVQAVALDAAATTVLTAGDDAALRLWPTNQDELIARACAAVSRNLTRSEWRQSFGALPYRSTCAERAD